MKNKTRQADYVCPNIKIGRISNTFIKVYRSVTCGIYNTLKHLTVELKYRFRPKRFSSSSPKSLLSPKSFSESIIVSTAKFL